MADINYSKVSKCPALVSTLNVGDTVIDITNKLALTIGSIQIKGSVVTLTDTFDESFSYPPTYTGLRKVTQ